MNVWFRCEPYEGDLGWKQRGNRSSAPAALRGYDGANEVIRIYARQLGIRDPALMSHSQKAMLAQYVSDGERLRVADSTNLTQVGLQLAKRLSRNPDKRNARREISEKPDYMYEESEGLSPNHLKHRRIPTRPGRDGSTPFIGNYEHF